MTTIDTTTFEALRQAYLVASNDLQTVSNDREVAKRAAVKAVEEAFSDQMLVVSKAAQAAYSALLREENRLVELKASTHPLAGRKVEAMRGKKGSYSSKRFPVQGVIEVITSDSDQPDNNKYRRLKQGELAVRLLNEKGKALKTVERLSLRSDVAARYAKEGHDLNDASVQVNLSHFFELVD